jgi:hypothetical protein
MIAFNPCGPLLSFTAAATPPTAVRAISLNNVQTQQYCLTNIDGAIDAIVGWGQSATEAQANALAPAGTARCYYLMAREQAVITGPSDAFFSAGTASVTAVIKVQAGVGI